MNTAATENTGSVKHHDFGAFGGVFTPSILTILGVVMFMRAGYVVGEAGVLRALGILILANSITFLTGLSICATATNTPVRGGGAYFMISRVLGPEFGGAIGMALFFGQALSVPFYIIGFTEALIGALPHLEPYTLYITISTAAVLFIMVYLGADWAIKFQFVILAVLAAAILVFLCGGLSHFDTARFHENFHPKPGFHFWLVFAIYFPAVTGIMAGVNMSGDLKDPGKAIPRGTLCAIGVGFLVYAVQILIIGGAQTRAELGNASFPTLVSQSLLGLGFLVIAGAVAASISSAVGSFMGAPRVMQALARDHILRPLKPFGAGSANKDEPRRALLLTVVITFSVLLYAGLVSGKNALNAVAVVVSMFFLYTYGMTNLAAFVESFGLNPSFRPRFRYFHWLTALAGAVGCGTAAFLIHPGAALAALVIVAAIYVYIRSRVLETAFGDARRGFIYARLRTNLFKLAKLPPHPKNWRPTVLAMTGNPATRATLARFAHWVGGGRGIVTLAEILVGDVEKMAQMRQSELRRMNTFVQEHNLSAFPEVIAAPDLDNGMTALLQAHLIGPLKPNLVMFGWPANPERAEAFTRHLRAARAIGMSLVVVLNRDLPGARRAGRIDIWWRGLENGSLMLLVAHLLQLNWEWAHSEIRVLRVVPSEQGREPATRTLQHIVTASRIDARVEIIVSNRPFSEVLHTHSANAGVILLGFQTPEETGVPAFDANYIDLLAGLPTTLLISSSGEADLMA